MPNISAIVLAAGEAKRMAPLLLHEVIKGKAEHKLLLPFAGKTIIECTVDAILPAHIAEVIVVLGHEAAAIQKILGDRPLRFAQNADYRSGMASSIHAGLAALSPSVQAVMIALADQPLIQPAELDILISAFSQQQDSAPRQIKTKEAERGKSIAVPTFRGQRGNPVIFDLRYRAEMLTLKGDVGCKSILARHPEAVLEVEMPTGNILEDVDTPEAYARIMTNSGN